MPRSAPKSRQKSVLMRATRQRGGDARSRGDEGQVPEVKRLNK